MNSVSKYKILGIISILLFIIGWILYSNLGIIIALIFEIIALILAIISSKKEKKYFFHYRYRCFYYFNCHNDKLANIWWYI